MIRVQNQKKHILFPSLTHSQLEEGRGSSKAAELNFILKINIMI